MARPKTKDELINQGQQKFDKLNALINTFSKEKQLETFPKGTLNRNIRDVLAHLHHWHLLMLNWYKVGMTGEKPAMPSKGYTWKTTPDLNKKINEKYNTTSLDEARKLVNASFVDVQNIIKKHTNEELFEKKRYKWTGTTSLGSYLVSATSSHYDWAIKLIKKAVK